MSSPQIKKAQLQTSYCSLSHQPLESIHTIKEGVDVALAILAKTLICAHDVEDLNLAYKKVDALEKMEAFQEAVALERGEVISPTEVGSRYILDQVIEKIENIYSKNKAINSKDLITLYHLRKFSEKDLPIGEVFEKVLSTIKLNIAPTDMARTSPFAFQRSNLMRMSPV